MLRASWIFTFVAVAMVVFIPLMLVGISFAEKKKNYRTHKNLQTFLAALLGVVLVLFETQIRMFGWRHLLSESSRFFRYVDSALYVHLCFAILAAVAWLVTVIHALYLFRGEPRPRKGSALHKVLGKISAVSMILTAVSGWIFYAVAFVL